MAFEKVSDIMIPLKDYAVVSKDATMLDALYAMDKARKKLPPGRHSPKACLVKNEKNQIVGKLGFFAFLQGLEPNYKNMKDIHCSARDRFGSTMVTSIMEDLAIWQEDIHYYAKRAKNTKVEAVMRPIEEQLDVDTPIGEAIHKFLIYNTLSILAIKDGKAVGIVRINDIFYVTAKLIKKYAK